MPHQAWKTAHPVQGRCRLDSPADVFTVASACQRLGWQTAGSGPPAPGRPLVDPVSPFPGQSGHRKNGRSEPLRNPGHQPLARLPHLPLVGKKVALKTFWCIL